ncbi:MAG: hypothetical protein RH917_18620 [Lacipirellulaceae bacterium]
MSTIEQISDFTKFAMTVAEQEGSDISLDVIYDRWREEAYRDEDARAILAAARDYENGERGELVEDVLAELRAERAAGESK